MKRLVVFLAIAMLAVSLAPVSVSAKPKKGGADTPVVAKVEVASVAALEAFANDHGIDLLEVLVESRGLAVFSPIDVKDLEKDGRVEWAEELDVSTTDDDRFHAWVQDLGLDVDRLDQTDEDRFHAWEEEDANRAQADSGCTVEFSDGFALIEWDEVPGAKRYAIFRDNVWLGRTKDTQTIDTAPDPAATYRYRAIYPGGEKGPKADCVVGAPRTHLGEGLENLGLDEIHRVSDGTGAVVAILDTGVDRANEGLAAATVDGWDFVDDDAAPRDEGNAVDDDGDGAVDESVGHGTHVAGIVNQVAPGATILAYRVLDSDGRGNYYAVAEAIDDAVAAGADVINLSFGGEKVKSKRFKESIKAAHAAGVVIIAAAGNDGQDKKQFPASEGSVLGVTAWDATQDVLPGFANYGKWVDVAAPGVRVGSILPNGRVVAWSGSSMAAPVVAGQAALIAAIEPGISPKEIEKVIRDSARKLDKKFKNKPEKGVVDLLASIERIMR